MADARVWWLQECLHQQLTEIGLGQASVVGGYLEQQLLQAPSRGPIGNYRTHTHVGHPKFGPHMTL